MAMGMKRCRKYVLVSKRSGISRLIKKGGDKNYLRDDDDDNEKEERIDYERGNSIQSRDRQSEREMRVTHTRAYTYRIMGMSLSNFVSLKCESLYEFLLPPPSHFPPNRHLPLFRLTFPRDIGGPSKSQ